MPELHPYPRFSLAERDRRWQAVREKMAEQNIDVIVTPQNTGHSMDFQANTRYLTHCGGGGDADIAAVFPLNGAVTAIATTANPRWTTTQDWTTDVREARREYGKIIVERLKELKIEHGRIGIAGLGEVEGTRTPEGTILHGTYEKIREAFPQAEIVDATPILTEVRYTKSEEEIAALTKSMEIVELAYQAEIEAANPGVRDWDVWASTQYALMRNGSEMPVHCNWISGKNVRRTLTRPSMRLLELGDSDHQRSRSVVDRLPLSGCAAGLCRQGRSDASRVNQSAARALQSRDGKPETRRNGQRASRVDVEDKRDRRAEIRPRRRRARRFEYARPRRRRRRSDHYRARQKPAPARDRAAGKYGIHL